MLIRKEMNLSEPGARRPLEQHDSQLLRVRFRYAKSEASDAPGIIVAQAPWQLPTKKLVGVRGGLREVECLRLVKQAGGK